MRIEVAEVDNQGRYDVFLGGDLICRSTLTPLCSAARVLISRGIDPNAMLEKTRRGADRVDMQARLGVAAGLIVEEGNHPPFFRRFKPFTTRRPDLAA